MDRNDINKVFGTHQKDTSSYCKTSKVTGPLSTERFIYFLAQWNSGLYVTVTKDHSHPFFLIMQLCLPCRHRGSLKFEFLPLYSPDCTLQRTNLLSVCGFGLVMDIAPGHGDGGVTVSSSLPTSSRFLGTVIPIGFCLLSSIQARSFPWRVFHRVTWV